MLPFHQVDVFTSRFLLGNPLAVVHGAEGLTGEQMAAFARWTNLSETTFLLPPVHADADYRVRIFTTQGELPFAGHPTLGSARAWLEAGGVPKADDLVQECGAGLVRVRRTGERLAFAAPPLVRGGDVDAADLDGVKGALRLRDEDVVGAQWADNGPGWLALLLKDADTVLGIRPDPAAFGEIDKIGVVGPYPPGGEVAYEVRAFVRTAEDPVTGSLNAAIGQWLISTGQAPDSYVAAQGTNLHRRGRVHIDRVGPDIWTGGDTVIGITGSVRLP